jgi:hypothetical protein
VYKRTKDDIYRGGCCSTSTSEQESPTGHHTSWGQPFVLAFGRNLTSPPAGSHAKLLVDVARTTDANDNFWAQQCLLIPSDAL